MSDEIKRLRSELHSIQQQFSTIKKAYDSLQLSFAQIEMVYEFAAALDTSIELDDLLTIIKNHFQKIYDADAFALFIKNEEDNTYSTATQFNVSATFLKDLDYNLNNKIIAELKDKNFYSIPKAENSTGFSDKNGSLLCIALQNTNHEVFALLFLVFGNKEEFTPGDIELFTRLAKHIANAVDNILRYEHFKELSFKDELTGLYNRRYFFQRFEIEEQRSNRYKRPMAVLMLDIDHFKKYNDSNGHLKGDELLRGLASKLNNILRKPDILARYGGEEFIILLPETSRNQAKKAAEKLRLEIDNHPFEHQETQPGGKVTLSIGGSSFPDDTPKPEKLISLADKALYAAKENGRNCVVWYKQSLNK